MTEVGVAEAESRYFAITFGLGRNLLRLDRFEENFGLTTTLNLVKEDDLRSLDTNSLGNGAMKHFIQMGHSSSLKDFGIDLEKDLVKNISGKIEETTLTGDVKSICGKQSVSISSSIDITGIGELLKMLYDHFQCQDYLERFPGMNHANIIKNRDRIEELDNRMLRIFNGEVDDESNFELSLPELRLNHEIGSFTYGSAGNHHTELDLDELKNDLSVAMRGRQITVQTLKNQHIRMFSEDGNITGKWTIYKCLSVDLPDRDKQYVLNEGKWYSFNMNYVQSIDDFYGNIEISGVDLQDYRIIGHDGETENQYNDRMCNSFVQFEKMDCQCLNPFDQTPFEVCDIYDKSLNSFVHVKHNTGSRVLSHLYLQGAVSGELMLNPIVREDLLRNKPNMSGHIQRDSYNTSSYEITYAIIDRSKASRTRNTNERPQLPFFSKISLRQTVNTLRNFGYQVKLKRIKWAE